MLTLRIFTGEILEPEVWKSLEILGYPSYDISSYGNVRNNITVRLIKPTIRPCGYYRTGIIDKDGKRSTLSIHRLVAQSFIASCPGDDYTVDHIDRNPSNNYYRNLRWATKEQQNENRTRGNGPNRPVNQYDTHGTFIRKWNTATEAGVFLEMADQGRGISKACRGERNTYSGYIWRYSDQVELINGELWMSVPDYDNIYASNMGRIKLASGVISYGSIGGSGYQRVRLSNKQTGEIKGHQVHRLVMEAFVGKMDNLQVNHKDGNKLNNKLENLEYLTQSQNLAHAHGTNLTKQYSRPVIRVTLATGERTRYSSIKTAAEFMGVSKSYIANRCHGRCQSNGKDGFYWIFGDEIPNTCGPVQNNIVQVPAKILSLNIMGR